jgi:cytochrome P450
LLELSYERDKLAREEELQVNAEALIVAGLEITATALTSMVYYLSQYSEYLAKLQTEVHGALLINRPHVLFVLCILQLPVQEVVEMRGAGSHLK